MATNLDKFVELKEKAEAAQQTADKAEGALNQILKQLKSEFGCNSLKDAEKKLEKLERQEKSSKREFDRAVEAFEENWEDDGND